MKLTQLKGGLPWWSKVAAKIILSRLPVEYPLWQRLGLFRHGRMDDAGYALDVFDAHLTRAGLQGSLAGKAILELGPGDSVASAIIAAAHGARAVLVDVGRFAKGAPREYDDLVQRLRAEGLSPPDISSCETLDDMLLACGAAYLTDGLRSLQRLDDESIDFIYSEAVLEHVRRNEFLATQRECARILRRTGQCSHQVDLRDHLGGGLNNLRFKEWIWESSFLVRSGFYTNRIQFEAMLGLFERAGFVVEVREVRRWKRLPIERRQLAKEFSQIPDEMLNVSVFDVLLRLPPSTAGE